MLISLKAGALGLNPTVANNVGTFSSIERLTRSLSPPMIQVYLMDPYAVTSVVTRVQLLTERHSWWQEGIESQAIDRCNW
jgi:hypothetical protein